MSWQRTSSSLSPWLLTVCAHRGRASRSWAAAAVLRSVLSWRLLIYPDGLSVASSSVVSAVRFENWFFCPVNVLYLKNCGADCCHFSNFSFWHNKVHPSQKMSLRFSDPLILTAHVYDINVFNCLFCSTLTLCGWTSHCWSECSLGLLLKLWTPSASWWEACSFM